MNEPNLIAISISAFAAVLVLLSLLALVIRAIAHVFRERPVETMDAMLVAALHAAAVQRYPGHRITRVEETVKGNQR